MPSLTLGTHPGTGSPPSEPHSATPDVDKGDPEGDGRFLRPRELDLRRTEAPGPGALPIRRTPHPRRHAIRTFDEKGRISDRLLFGVLEWHRRMPVSIRVHDSGALVVRRDPRGESRLTERTMVAVPAQIMRWCGSDKREQVLLVAVPSLSALVIHGQETLDRLSPDSEQIVTEVYALGEGPPASPAPPGTSGVAGTVDAGVAGG